MAALRRRSRRVSAERLKGRAVAVIVKAGARRLGWQGLPLPSILRPYLPQSAPLAGQNLPNPVIRSHYGNGFIKQYVRDIDGLDIVRAVGLKAA
jgi:hypothetical protein